MKQKVDVFKESGKWYTDEEIEIPDDVKPWNYRDYITENDLFEGRLKGMTMLGHYPNEVPFLMVIQ